MVVLADHVNTKLVKYGIEEEDTDYRIHVCGLVNICYVYPTILMVNFIRSRSQQLREVTVSSYGCITAKGYLVPIVEFFRQGIGKEYLLPTDIWTSLIGTENEKGKGLWAVSITKKALENNIISFPYLVKEENNIVNQLKGQDLLIVTHSVKVQVKCDLRSCLRDRHPQGTGNLFIQTWECNPTKQY